MRESAYALALAGFSFMLTVIWGEPLLRGDGGGKSDGALRCDGAERESDGPAEAAGPDQGAGYLVPLLRIVLNSR